MRENKYIKTAKEDTDLLSEFVECTTIDIDKYTDS